MLINVEQRRLFSFCLAGGGSIEEKSRQVIEKERFCQNTGYIPARGLGRNWDEGASGERREGRWSGGGDGSRYISTAMRYGFS